MASALTSETVTVRAMEGDTLDLICWRHYGATAPVDTVLAANPGLAALGVIIPMGTVITLPAITTVSTTSTTEVSLW